ncbi:MAG: tetratricopeptide repeat protein, partial [Pirellulales bacterium]
FPQALLAAARLRERLKQPAEASDLYRKFAEDLPKSPQLDEAVYRWAWAQRDLNRASDAEALFGRVHDQFPASRFWADATFRLAEAATARGDFDRAQKLLAELESGKAPQDLAAHSLYLRGQMAAQRQKWDEVYTPMARLIQDHPASPLRLAAEYWIAEASYRQGNYDDAGRRFDQLARRVAGRQDSWLAMVPLRRAQLLAQKRKWDEAYELAAGIAEAYGDFSQQHEVDYLLGRALAARGEFDDARAAYGKVIRSTHGSKTETAAMAQWMIGETYFHQKRYEEAIREYLRVEILYGYPRWQAASLLQAGKAQEALGDWKEATTLYAQVLEKYRDTPYAEPAAQRLRVVQQQAVVTTR